MAGSHSDQRGFTLLELLVVLFILVIIVGLVTPYIRADSDDDLLKTESQRLRFVLQDTVDQSWITSNSFVVMREKDSILTLWQQKKGTWNKLRTLYTLPKNLSLQLNIDRVEVKKALAAIQFKQSEALVFLSSGEYLPFTLVLRSKDQSIDDSENNTVKISGDGINEIVIK